MLHQKQIWELRLFISWKFCHEVLIQTLISIGALWIYFPHFIFQYQHFHWHLQFFYPSMSQAIFARVLFSPSICVASFILIKMSYKPSSLTDSHQNCLPILLASNFFNSVYIEFIFLKLCKSHMGNIQHFLKSKYTISSTFSLITGRVLSGNETGLAFWLYFLINLCKPFWLGFFLLILQNLYFRCGTPCRRIVCNLKGYRHPRGDQTS